MEGDDAAGVGVGAEHDMTPTPPGLVLKTAEEIREDVKQAKLDQHNKLYDKIDRLAKLIRHSKHFVGLHRPRHLD